MEAQIHAPGYHGNRLEMGKTAAGGRDPFHAAKLPPELSILLKSFGNASLFYGIIDRTLRLQ
jgi:hypothetical protein